MRRTFSTSVSNAGVNIWLLLSRMAIGAIMLTHGIPKLQNLLAGKLQFGNPIGIGEVPSLILAIFAEFLCSVLLIVGLATRFASICLLINMAVVVFFALSNQPFAKKELAILYLLFYLGFCILGGGKYSIDSLISRKSRRRY